MRVIGSTKVCGCHVILYYEHGEGYSAYVEEHPHIDVTAQSKAELLDILISLISIENELDSIWGEKA